ncbi:MAG: hypothetical protein R3A52_04285 [Polyangiales bacterium]
MRRCAAALSLVALLCSGAAEAQTRHRRRIDRYTGTLAIGGAVGVGAPRGFASAFMEFRPHRLIGFNFGGGTGGTFGPAIEAGVWTAPIGGRDWAIGFGGSWARNYSVVNLPEELGRGSLPAHGDWLSVSAGMEFRPSRSLMIRFTVGHSWLTNTAEFNVGTVAEINQVEAMGYTLPGTSPIDAARAAASGETLGMWFGQVEIAPLIRLW